MHQRHQRRVEIRIALEGRAQQRFDFATTTAGLIEHGQVEVGFGAFGQALLYRFVLGDGRIPVRLGAAQAIAGHAQQIPGRGNPHSLHRVGQQRRQQRRALRWRQERADRPHGAFTHLRRRVAQVLGGQFQRLFTRVQRQLGQQGRALNRWQIAALQLLVQGLCRAGLAVANQPQAFVITRGLRGGALFQSLNCSVTLSPALPW